MAPKKVAPKAAPPPSKKAPPPPVTKAAPKGRPKKKADDDEEEEADQVVVSPSPKSKTAPAAQASEESPASAAARAMKVVPGPIPSPGSGGKGSSSASAEWALTAKPIPGRLSVPYPAHAGAAADMLGQGLVRLRRAGNLCDLVVVAGAGRLPVHRTVLAAHSETMMSRLQEDVKELDFRCSHEAADLVVRWIYGEVDSASYLPSTAKVNEEVLQVSSEFGLLQLSELCAARLAGDADFSNVVIRIRLCEEFGLPKLRAALVTAIVEDAKALHAVATDPITLTHPGLMRELLASIAANTGGNDDADDARPGKRLRGPS